MAYSSLWRSVVTKCLKLEDVESYKSTINPVRKGIKRPGSLVDAPKSHKLQPMDLNESGQVWVAPGPGADLKQSEVDGELGKELERLLLTKPKNSRGKPKSSIKSNHSGITKVEYESVKTETESLDRQDKKASKSPKPKDDSAILKAKSDRYQILRLIHVVLDRICELEMSKYGDIQHCLPCVEENEEQRREALMLIDIYQKSLNNVNIALDALNYVVWNLEQEGGDSEQELEKLKLQTALMQARVLLRKFRKQHYTEYLKLRSDYRQKYATQPLRSQTLFQNDNLKLYPHEQYLLWKVFLHRFNNITVLISEELRLGLVKPSTFVKNLNAEIISFTNRFPMNMNEWEMLLNYKASKPNPEREKKYDQLKTQLFGTGFPRITWLPSVPSAKIPKFAPLCPAARAALEAQGIPFIDAVATSTKSPETSAIP